MPAVTNASTPTSGRIDPRFAELYERHFAWVWSVLGRLGIHGSQREDAVQEVWITVHRRLDSLDPVASQRAWLFAIARRVTALHHRTGSRAARRLGALRAVPSVEATTPADRAEARELLDRILNEMGATQRDVLMLSCVKGLTGPEIAEALAVPLNTVYSRLRLARRHADAELARAFPETTAAPAEQRRCWIGLLPFVAPASSASGPAPAVGETASVSGPLLKALIAATALATLTLTIGTLAGARPASAATSSDPEAAGPSDNIPRPALVAPDTPTPNVRADIAAAARGDRSADRRAADQPTDARQGTSAAAAPNRSVPSTTGSAAKRSGQNAAGHGRRAPKPRQRSDDATPEPPPKPRNTLADENRLMKPALNAVKRGDPRVALRFVAEHATRFPHGVLEDVRVATQVRALCQLDERASAQQAARRFMRVRPQSLSVRRALAECE